jgi:hypothetical protein
MAKLSPKDPQFGIPVASRISIETAFLFNEEAVKQGISLSRYISHFIETALSYQNSMEELEVLLSKQKEATATSERKIAELHAQLIRERELFKRAIGRFIVELSDGKEKRAIQLINNYNKILQDEKSK